MAVGRSDAASVGTPDTVIGTVRGVPPVTGRTAMTHGQPTGGFATLSMTAVVLPSPAYVLADDATAQSAVPRRAWFPHSSTRRLPGAKPDSRTVTVWPALTVVRSRSIAGSAWAGRRGAV